MVSKHVVTLANSIIGVSVLAMPFCFKQCGIVLATLMLMMGAVLTRMVCYFLIKSATITRRRTYEVLAYHTFGQAGKFMVEISIIGFLIGTMIAFMVVIGDLGPEILSDIFSMENSNSLRTIIMTALSLFVALPLGLLRNMDSLSSVSTASVLFYIFLVFKILGEGIGPLWSGFYLDKIDYWRPAGVLQCIPIFSMALSCQTQIFGIYDSLPDPSLQKMNEIIKKSINLCTFFYFCVGFFGYIAYCTQNFGGNILLSFSPTWSTQLIKICFLMSIVFSCPLVIFPCRASLHSLIFRRVHIHHHVHDISTNYIPDTRLKFLTVGIVAFTLVVGLLIPNIELVLGLVGSTTGSVICIIFPSIMFIRVTSKNTTERLLAQAVFVVGVCVMVLTTYVTLYAVEKAQISDPVIADQVRMTETARKLLVENEPQIDLKSTENKDKGEEILKPIPVEFQPKIPIKVISGSQKLPVFGRMSPSPGKQSSPSSLVDKGLMPPESKLDEDKFQKENVQVAIEIANAKQIADSKAQNYVIPNDQVENKVEVNDQRVAAEEKKKVDEQEPENVVDPPVESREAGIVQQQKNPLEQSLPIQNNKVVDRELPPQNSNDIAEKQKEAEQEDKKEFVGKQAEEFLKKLEEHQENQKKLLEEQKEILEELKQHHAADVIREGGDLKSHNDNANKPQKPSEVPVHKSEDSPAVQKDVPPPPVQEIKNKEQQIIDKLAKNLETENRNAELLQKLEEGFNKEIKEIDAQPKVAEVPHPAAPLVERNSVNEKKSIKNANLPVPEAEPINAASHTKDVQINKNSIDSAPIVKKSVLEVLGPPAGALNNNNQQQLNPVKKIEGTLGKEKEHVINIPQVAVPETAKKLSESNNNIKNEKILAQQNEKKMEEQNEKLKVKKTEREM